MRIRKHSHASFSSSHTCEALLTHVCQLNRSPWDAMTFSPQESFHFQLGASDDCPSMKEENKEREESKPAAGEAKGKRRGVDSGEPVGCAAATRARRSRASSSSASSDFYYYYSGVGPMWRRRRRGRGLQQQQQQQFQKKMNGSDDSRITPSSSSSSSSSSSTITRREHDHETDDIDDDDDGSGFKRPVKVRSLKSLL